MKIYLEPETNSRGIMRVRDALEKYMPKGFETVQKAEDSDLEIIHVFGRHDAIERRVRRLQSKNKPYAMIQYCLRSTMHPSTHDWISMWEKAKVVWSYYNLPELCREDEMGDSLGDGSYIIPGFSFYHAPLGVDADVFVETKAPKKFMIAACSQHALAEGARECAFAVKRVGGSMFFLGHELRRGPDIVCKDNLSDEEVAQYFSQCQYISGLRRVEGFELPVIEGALCGARPIVYDKPHYQEWFGDFAVFIPEGPRDSVINRLEQIFTDDVSPVTEEEKEMIRDRFSWSKIINGFYNKL